MIIKVLEVNNLQELIDLNNSINSNFKLNCFEYNNKHYLLEELIDSAEYLQYRDYLNTLTKTELIYEME